MDSPNSNQPPLPLPLRALAIGLFGVLPFIWFNGLIDPVLLPQYLFHGLIVVIATTPSLFKQPSKITFPRWPLLGLLAWWVLVALSVFQAISLPIALFEAMRWGVFVLTTLLFYQTQRRHPNFLPLVLKTLVVGSLTQASLAVYNWLPYVATDLQNPFPVGTHVNSNLYGLAFLFCLPFLVLAVFQLKKSWKILATVAVISALAMIYGSGSRAASLALAIAIPVTGLALGIRYLRKSPRFAIGALLLTIVVLGIAWWAMGIAFRGKVGSENFQLLWQENAELTPQSPSLDHRMVLWNKTMDMVGDQPLLGTGIGNWKLNVAAYGFHAYDDQGNFGMDIPQRTHNHILEMAAEIGIPGLVAFLFVLGMAIWGSARFVLQKEGPEFQQGLALLAFWIACLAPFMFNFPLERPFHLLIVALALALSFQGFPLKTSLSNKLISGLAIGLSSVFVLFCAMKMRDETDFKKVRRLKASQQWEELWETPTSRFSNWQPINPETGLPLSWYKGLAALALGKGELGLEKMEAAREIAPHHIAVRANLAAAYNLVEQYQDAKEIYSHLLQDFPSYEDARLNLAVTLFQMGNWKGAELELSKIVSLKGDPRYIALQEQLKLHSP